MSCPGRHTRGVLELESIDSKQPGDVARAIAERGKFYKVANRELGGDPQGRVRNALLAGIESIEGAEGRAAAEAQGLDNLHLYFPIEKVRELKHFVLERLREDLILLTARVGREFLGIKGEFFIDSNTILRINYPFEQARKASHTTDDPSVGSPRSARLALWQKLAYHPKLVALRVRISTALGATRAAGDDGSWAAGVDYDPAAYHKKLPPAAWAHGPHIDTWYGHAYDGVNLWWAIAGVNTENSLVLYPESFGVDVQPDPRSMYLAPGFQLPRPAALDLSSGDMLLFNPEILHATQLNTSNSTRIAITTRINPSVPSFDPRAPFARSHWLAASDVERRRFDRVRYFPRALHLRVARKTSAATCQGRTMTLHEEFSEQPVRVCDSSELGMNDKVTVRFDNAAILLFRSTKGVFALANRCPHLGLELSDGFHDDERIHCPGHGLSFDLATGKSRCDAFRLRAFVAYESEGGVYVQRRVGQRAALAADG